MKTNAVRVLIGLSIVLLAVAGVSAGDAKNVEPAEGQAQVILAVEGMTCGGCCTKVETAMNGLEGIVAASADYQEGTATITYETEKVTVEKIVKTINEETSFKASMPKKNA
jgi:copper chaperone CopZ